MTFLSRDQTLLVKHKDWKIGSLEVKVKKKQKTIQLISGYSRKIKENSTVGSCLSFSLLNVDYSEK